MICSGEVGVFSQCRMNSDLENTLCLWLLSLVCLALIVVRRPSAIGYLQIGLLWVHNLILHFILYLKILHIVLERFGVLYRSQSWWTKQQLLLQTLLELSLRQCIPRQLPIGEGLSMLAGVHWTESSVALCAPLPWPAGRWHRQMMSGLGGTQINLFLCLL